MADQAKGGQGLYLDSARCIPMGMPWRMYAFFAMDFAITPSATYILSEAMTVQPRRIYTDGRDWPEYQEPLYTGYSIGKWIDEDGDGKYDVLEVETRHFKGPRVYDGTGLPLHHDNKTVIKERIYLDKANPNLLNDDMTVIDHALTRPWSVTKKARRDQRARPMWQTSVCAENNSMVKIGKDPYYVSQDGYLMPVKKGQAPPDLRFFTQSPK